MRSPPLAYGKLLNPLRWDVREVRGGYEGEAEGKQRSGGKFVLCLLDPIRGGDGE